MLQLTTSATTTGAVWLDQTSFPFATLALALTASYSGQKQDVFCSVTSRKSSGYGMWVLFTVDGGELPNESGQYDVDIYYASGEKATWGNFNALWVNADQQYSNPVTFFKVGSKLGEERAFISGSDFDSTTKYEYQDEPVYSVYDG